MMKHKLIVLLLVLLLIVLAGCSGAQTEPTTAPTLAPIPTEILYELYGTEPPTEPPVEVDMPEFQFTYSGELKDSVVMKEVEGSGALEFTVILSGGEAHIFTLHYNTVEGDYVTVLDDAAGNKIPVAFQMAAVPEGLSDEDTATFYQAQESVNEIVDSLILK